jgi:DNA-binding transcriptional ArsR family regulator
MIRRPHGHRTRLRISGLLARQVTGNGGCSAHPTSRRPRSCARRRSVRIYNLMVVDKLSEVDVDRIFHALADGTRRDILGHALGAKCSVSALAKRYPMSFAAVQKHVAVLEDAGLITKERQGRQQLVRTDVDTVGKARALLDGIEGLWRARMDRIDDLLATDKRTSGDHK